MPTDLAPRIEAVNRSGSSVSMSGGTPMEVLSIHAVAGAGNLRGLVTVRLGALVIHGWRVVQQPGQRAYVSVPQQQNRDGRWFPLVEVRNPDLLAEVRRAVLESWEAAR